MAEGPGDGVGAPFGEAAVVRRGSEVESSFRSERVRAVTAAFWRKVGLRNSSRIKEGFRFAPERRDSGASTHKAIRDEEVALASIVLSLDEANSRPSADCSKYTPSVRASGREQSALRNRRTGGPTRALSKRLD